jgi:hypothetical protein
MINVPPSVGVMAEVASGSGVSGDCCVEEGSIWLTLPLIVHPTVKRRVKLTISREKKER